jgi:hypothetical protein
MCNIVTRCSKNWPQGSAKKQILLIEVLLLLQVAITRTPIFASSVDSVSRNLTRGQWIERKLTARQLQSNIVFILRQGRACKLWARVALRFLLAWPRLWARGLDCGLSPKSRPVHARALGLCSKSPSPQTWAWAQPDPPSYGSLHLDEDPWIKGYIKCPGFMAQWTSSSETADPGSNPTMV